MARERKTIDVWEIHVNYGGGWEYECAEFNIHAAFRQLRAYRENCGYPCRMLKKRDPKSNYSAEQLAEIELNNKKDREAYWEQKRQRILAMAKAAHAN